MTKTNQVPLCIRRTMKFPPAKLGLIDFVHAAASLGMSAGDLAETLGFHAATASNQTLRRCVRVQTRLSTLLKILARVRPWAGSDASALAWYWSATIPALAGRTAEDMVRQNRGSAVHAYLDRISFGGFA